MDFGSMFNPMSWFGGGGGNEYHDPTKGANNYLDQISKMLPGYYQPWINAGKGALGGATNQYNQATFNPQGMYEHLAEGYEQSPGFKQQLQQALQGANQAAAAGGMAGSPMSQQWGADIAQQMTSRDFENFMNRKQNIWQTGLGGLGDQSKMGFLGSQGLGENLANVLGSKANLAFQGDAGRNTWQSGQNAGNTAMMGSIAQFLPYLMMMMGG
jgi:hypothetical protein